MSTVTTVSSGGGSGMGFLFLIFLILKLTGTITWSWWWVTSPLWLPTVFGLGIVFGALAVAAILVSIGFVAFLIANAIDKWKGTE